MNDKPKNGKGYTTDLNEMVKREITSHMRPFLDVILRGQEEVMQEVKKHTHFHKLAVDNRTMIVAGIAIDLFLAIGIVMAWVIN